MITSGDVAPLAHKARVYARAAHLSGAEAREEFFKLALDCGLSLNVATAIREAAGKA